MATAFFGLVVGKKKTPLPAFPEDDEIDFKLTNAALSGGGKDAKVQLFVHYSEEKYLVCVLNDAHIPQAHIELVFSSDIPFPIAFSIEGGNKDTRVHLTGFCSRQADDMEGIESDDEDDEERAFLERVIAGEMGGESEEDDSEESEEESDEEDDGPILGIQEIKEEEPEPVQKKKKSLSAIDVQKKGGNQNKKGPKAAQNNKGKPNAAKPNANKGGPKTPQANKGKPAAKANADKGSPKTPQANKGKPAAKANADKGPKTPTNTTKPKAPASERKPVANNNNKNKKRKTSPSESSVKPQAKKTKKN